MNLFGQSESRSRFMRGLVGALTVLIAAGAVWFSLRWYSSQAGRPPLYHDSFRLDKQEEWQPFGGAWEIVDGAMRNNSDERGA
jgi:hypothetical protein